MQDPPEELSEEHSFLIEWLRKKIMLIASHTTH
jgi:hypothetical protein